MRSYLPRSMCALSSRLLWHVHGGCKRNPEGDSEYQDPPKDILNGLRNVWQDTATYFRSRAADSFVKSTVDGDNAKRSRSGKPGTTTGRKKILPGSAIRAASPKNTVSRSRQSCSVWSTAVTTTTTTANLADSTTACSRPKDFFVSIGGRGCCGGYG